MDDKIQIETPEHVTFEYTPAGLVSRMFACFIDTALQGVLVVVGFLVFMLFTGASLRSINFEAIDLIGAAFIIFVFVVWWGYYIFFEITMNGRTPGKKCMGMRVVKVSWANRNMFEQKLPAPWGLRGGNGSGGRNSRHVTGE